MDDDPQRRRVLGEVLRGEGATVSLAASVREGLCVLGRQPCDIAFLSSHMVDEQGIPVMATIRRAAPEAAIILLCDAGEADATTDVLRSAACGRLSEPMTAAKVSVALAQAVGSVQRRAVPSKALPRISEPNGLAVSTAWQEVLRAAERVARVDVPVLIRGETGVGKELLARWIHAHSDRVSGPFACVRCASIRDDQLEAFWFGEQYAGQSRGAILELAAGGTLFVQDVAELPVWFQGRLVEVLHRGAFSRPWDNRMIPLDVRLIAATSQPLERAVAEHRFLTDLYYQLNVVPIHIPPLRERRADIRALAEHFLAQASALYDRSTGTKLRFSRAAMASLLHYGWPGNVQELANVVKRAVLAHTGSQIELEDISYWPAEEPASHDADKLVVSLSDDLKAIERRIITAMIQRHHGNKTAAARALGLHRKTMYRMLHVRRCQEDNLA